jgi:hypothetical protein
VTTLAPPARHRAPARKVVQTPGLPLGQEYAACWVCSEVVIVASPARGEIRCRSCASSIAALVAARRNGLRVVP